MGAIKDDLGTVRGECILCMDCVYDCAQNVTRFAWRPATEVEKAETPPKEGGGGVSRRDFLLLLLSSLFALGFRNRTQMGGGQGGVIRPPGALGEEHFVNRCIRCGNCMKVCITNGLQPVMFQSGLEGIWTPQLVPEIGYCEYRCTLCGDTCPTSAIPSLSLEAKQKVRLGLAEIDRSICLPWALGRECIVCQEHCPVFQKAIKLTREGALSKPSIDEELCIGCGICQNKCPVRPVRAVRVSPRNSDRT
jgi:ferredoxin